MKINAIYVLKNDADIIEEALLNAMKFCHRIYLFDNHSDDGTWEIVQSMADRFKQIVIAVRSDEPYHQQLRNRVYNMYHHLYGESDWWYLGNADELLDSSPRSILKKALSAEKNRVDVWLADFYFTDEDLKHYGSEKHSQPISERRRYYRINGREARFFTNEPYQTWPENASGQLPHWAGKNYQSTPVCRRYAQRTPEQIKASYGYQIQLKCSAPNQGPHTAKAFLKQARKLHRYNKGGHFAVSWQDKLYHYLSAGCRWIQRKLNNLSERILRQSDSSKVKSAVQLTKGH